MRAAKNWATKALDSPQPTQRDKGSSLSRLSDEMKQQQHGGGERLGLHAATGKCNNAQRYGLGKGNGGAPSPALLTSNIKNARTLEELFRTVAKNIDFFNHIHLSACWNSLGHLAWAADKSWFQEHANVLELLVQHTARTVSNGSDIRGRELANITHGVAKSGRGTTMCALMTALAKSIESRLHDCNEQEIANISWGFAKAGHLNAGLFAALARAAERRLDNFKGQELANTAWGFATGGYEDAALFAAMARVVERRLADFNVQGLVNTAWAFAKAGHADAPLFRAMAKICLQRVGEFNAQDTAHTAWAFAKAGHFDAELLAALAGAAQRHLERSPPTRPHIKALIRLYQGASAQQQAA
jgi:hypothetical protein